MSQNRNLLSLGLAAAFGIFNGVWVFGPALKEQQEKKQAETGQVIRELEKEDNEITKLREPDAAATVTSFAELSSAASNEKQNSWWQTSGAFQDDTNNKSSMLEEGRLSDNKTER